MKKIFFLYTMLPIIYSSHGMSQTIDSTLLKSIISAENTYTLGEKEHDTSLLSSVWDPSFIDIDESGEVHSKAHQLSKVAQSKARILSLTVDQQHIKYLGCAAVVSERFKVVYLFNHRKHTESGRATDVWQKIDGKWKCILAQSTKIQ